MINGGAAFTPASACRPLSRPASVRSDDQDVFVYRMRVHRDLVP